MFRHGHGKDLSMLRHLVAFIIRRIDESHRGQTLVEYGLLLSFVALAVIGILLLFGPGVSGLYQSFFDEMP
jgi:Flp pilus assembly pilin Flp